jgi:Excalibur calcium-binding domain/Protein of unknown function (DUF1524)
VDIRSLVAVIAAVVLLSSCGPAADSPTALDTSAQSASTSPDIAQTPTPTVTQVTVPVATSTQPKPAAAGTALAAVARLTVKGRAPKTGYTRDQFGQAWFDVDRNGCDTRNDILRRDLSSRQMQNACKVLAGTLAPDPYTGTSIRFVYGGASEVDIDHVVALSDAWQKGAASWSAGKRLELANDPLNLLAVDASANRSKGDGDTATWLPVNKSFRCTYVARQVAVKGKYGVWVTSAEKDAMTRVLQTCPTMPLPGPGSASTVATPPRGVTQPVPQPAPEPLPASPARGVYYENCAAARAAGAAPIHLGEPGYSSKLDRDNDGIACE